MDGGRRGVGDLSVDLGDLSVDLGDLSVDLGDLSVDLGDLSVDLGDLSVDLGDLSADLWDLSVDLVDLSVDLGDLGKKSAPFKRHDETYLDLFSHIKNGRPHPYPVLGLPAVARGVAARRHGVAYALPRRISKKKHENSKKSDVSARS